MGRNGSSPLSGAFGDTEAATSAEGDASKPRDAAAPLPPGHKLGRYMVLDVLGRGGMGIVYAAYDPQLDRKVALKLLRTSGTRAKRHTQRLLREAQAMARLSHPNVIAVHDVGTFEGEVFLAMEFVEGGTVGEWLEEGERSLLLVSDVTTSEWLSDRLETLQRDTRDIIENINSALLVVDLAGHITFANRAAEQILGGRDGDLEGRQVADWFGAEGEAASPIEECLLQGTRSRGTETLLQRADGQWIPVGVSCSPRFDRDGRSRGAVAIFQDLSEIKELELHMRQTEKMASVGQLAAGVAHEVNNPMGFIHANLNQMAEYLGDFNRYFEATSRLVGAALEGDAELVRAAAEDVASVSREIDFEYVRQDFEKALLESSEGAERIRHIVKDLRDFSRPDLPERVAADLNQALDSTANIVFTMMKHAVELEKDYGVLPKIDAYPMQLKQVFMNLLVNAYQAIEARDAREPGVIRLETRREGDEIVVRIADTGIGIDAAHLARIFEPFFTTKPVGTGTGLGLSTSYRIVERHGGRITVESEVGRGTTFEVWLPLHPEPTVEDG